MKYDKEITYSTGEFAAHFGIKKDTLFYYDKIKLFCPAGIKSNGYRYYTASQIEPFRTLLSLRELNVPIKTLQEYFQNPSPEKLAEISSRQLERIQKEIEKLKHIQGLLTQITCALQEANDADFGYIKIEKIPPKHMLYSKQTGESLETSEQQWSAIHDDFILNSDITGASNVGSVITEADLKNGNFDRIDRLFAEAPDKTGIVRKSGQYAIYYHKGSYKNIKFAYQRMFSQIEALGYSPVGAAYEEYLVAETATKKEEEYVTKIMIRVESCNQTQA